MRTFKSVFAIVTVGFLFFGLTGPFSVSAATTPSLGEAASYGILASTFTNTSVGTTVNGDVGFTTGPATPPGGVHAHYGSGAPYATAGTDQGTALSALAAEVCTFTFGAAVELSTDTTHGPAGVFTPGVYCSIGAMNVGGPLTLNGNGTYIFRAVGAFTSTAGSIVTLSGGASACNVFWTPSGATTLGANTTFVGTVIDDSAITVGANTAWTGRALAFAGTVTTGDTDTITVPTCTAPPATLHVIKQVVNDSGGIASSSSFNVHVKLSGTDVAGSPAVGDATGTSYSLAPGTYVVSEDANGSYAQSFSGDCDSSGSITLATGVDKTCTITNDDIPPAPATLRVIKSVINDDGGTAVVSDAIVHVKSGLADVAGSPQVGFVSPGTSYSLAAGTYAVSEEIFVGYDATFSGDCDADGGIVLSPGQSKSCTITNDDIEPVIIPSPTGSSMIFTGTINVVKVIINDNGGAKTIADFPLFINDTSIISGATNIYPANTNRYVVTEVMDPNYAQTFSGDCDAEGIMYLHPFERQFCVITNNDIGAPVVVPPVPPLIDVVKIPDPLALPDGSGPVTYTFTLRNIGTVPVTAVTMVDDSCSLVDFISGDSNADARLDVTETWIYRCTAMLSETHTSAVLAAGWANGLSAVDVATATVVVGIPVVPPLIHVTKVPNPLVLSVGGGMVTYTEMITNPGTVSLNNVRLTDDKCSPMVYVSGDTNGDAKLDPTESWVYTCRHNLTETTTNIALASGEANNITAKDIAVVTVVVAAAPVLPSAGSAPPENISAWYILTAGIFGALLIFYVMRKRRAA